MAINFPDSPTNGQQISAGGNTWQYNSTKSVWEKTLTSGRSSVGTTTYATISDLPISGVNAGQQAFVSGSNRLYVSNGSGWYSISLVNTNPNITSVQDASSGTTPFTLTTDGTATVITVTAADPEDVPLTYNYSVTSGSLTNGGGTTATVSQADNVFTVTPSTTEAYAGTFELTFTASDGINTATSANSFTLEFITIIANSKYTTLLATAVDTSDNNNVTDASTNNHSITVTGDAHTGTFSPHRSGGYSLGFTGNSYITFSNSSTFELTGDFCIDGFWYLPTTNSGTIFELGQYQNGILFGPDQYDNGIYVNGSKLTGNGADGLGSSVTVKTWQHFAIVRKGSGSNNLKLYVDGTKVTESTVTANINSNYGSYTNIRIGSATHTSGSGSDLDDGSYIRDLRIVKGDSVYPSSSDSVPPNSITVPTEKSTAITGTILLAGALPYLADASTTNSTFTATNTVATKPFSPYDYDEYAATDHGGSINFDGTSDYLTIPDHSSLNFASNDWTIECWVYPRTNVGDCGIWHQSASGTDWFGLYLDGSFNPKFVLKNNNAEEWAGTAAANTAPQNTWTHIALVRRFGTDIKLYANGKVVHTETQHLNVALENKTYNHVIGYERFVGSGTYFDGFISDFKMDIGTAHYTAEFTPPTAPLSSSGADMHIKGTDASIIDKSQGANLKLIGDTTGSTTQVKFANTKSMYFDGSLPSDEIRFDVVSLPNDFTLEYWVKLSTYNDDVGIFGYTGSTNSQQRINHSGTFGKIMLYISGYVHQTTNCFTQSEAEDWMHIAYSRHNGTLKLYVNGTEKESVSYTSEIGIDIIGAGGYNNGNDHLDGYLQDFRITNGLARYTANFTPPTAPLEG